MKEHDHEVCAKTLQIVLEKKKKSDQQHERYPEQE